MKVTRLATCLALATKAYAITTFWMENIAHQGLSPYNSQGAAYSVFRNVKTYGAFGDGIHDDTAAIQAAIAAGSRCVPGIAGGGGCPSSTTSPAVVYFPAGTYLVSASIRSYYMTQMIGNPNSMPVLKATAAFTNGQSVIDADPYDSANQDYANGNIFYRQVRNIIIDMTGVPATQFVRGIHWPTAQATSLQNMVFKMSTASGNLHQGVYIENGSGGFLGDLVFSGGSIGMNLGSQQFTSRNLTFNNAGTAILQNWDWGWTYIGLSINNCAIGIDMSAGGNSAIAVGSMVVIDSSFTNTSIGIYTVRYLTGGTPNSGGSLVIENSIFSNVGTIVRSTAGVALAGSTASITIAAWVEGNIYAPTGPTLHGGTVTPFPRPASLLGSTGGNYYTRAKPTYADLPVSSFSSVRTAGAKGDGVTDDTAALQSIITSATAAGNVVYFDYGIYKISSYLTIPPGAKIVGESYPVILAAGSYFANINVPVPVVRVADSTGQTGIVEWSDMIIATQGASAAATLIQWNLASPATTPSGMWDVHTRIGGFTGSGLQVAQCAVGNVQPNVNCYGAFMSMRITTLGSGVYLENVWLWTADHDIDDSNSTQITIYSGRGLSVESTVGNVWLIATAAEHHALFQYQFSGTKNIFMGFAQTETPYYQPSPPATTPYVPIASRNDPDFGVFCSGKGANCYMAWGVRLVSSTNIMIYGAGLYSFFNNYNSTCSNHNATVYTETCQSQIFGIDEGGPVASSGSTIWAYALNTVGAVSMIDRLGASLAQQSANTNEYAETIVMFRTS